MRIINIKSIVLETAVCHAFLVVGLIDIAYVVGVMVVQLVEYVIYEPWLDGGHVFELWEGAFQRFCALVYVFFAVENYIVGAISGFVGEDVLLQGVQGVVFGDIIGIAPSFQVKQGRLDEVFVLGFLYQDVSKVLLGG